MASCHGDERRPWKIGVPASGCAGPACRPTTPATARFVWGRARPQLQARDHLFELHLPDRPNRRLHGAGPRLRPTRLRESRVAEPRAFRAQEQEWRREALALSAEE